MRYSKIQEAHVERRQIRSRATCDSCGRDVEHRDHLYHEEEVTIAAQIGAVYPEGNRQRFYDVDICGECFVNKVVPSLAALGIVVRVRGIESPEEVPEVIP